MSSLPPSNAPAPSKDAAVLAPAGQADIPTSVAKAAVLQAQQTAKKASPSVLEGEGKGVAATYAKAGLPSKGQVPAPLEGAQGVPVPKGGPVALPNGAVQPSPVPALNTAQPAATATAKTAEWVAPVMGSVLSNKAPNAPYANGTAAVDPKGQKSQMSAPELPWTEVRGARKRATSGARQIDSLSASKGKDIPRDKQGDAYVTGPSPDRTRLAEDDGRTGGTKKRRRTNSPGNRFDVLPVDVTEPTESQGPEQWPALPHKDTPPLGPTVLPNGSLVPSGGLPSSSSTSAPRAASQTRRRRSDTPPGSRRVSQDGPVDSEGHAPNPGAQGQPAAVPGQAPHNAPVQGQGNAGNVPANTAAQFGAGGNQGAPLQNIPPTDTSVAATFPPNSVPFCELIQEVAVGLHPQVAAAWDALPGPKAGIRPWMSRRNINATHTIDVIRADVAHRVNVPPEAVRLYFPTPAGPGSNYSAPNQLLLQFNPELVPAQEALNHIMSMFNNGSHGFRNTAAATYWVIPYTNPHAGSTFMGTIAGLSGLMATDTGLTQRADIPGHVTDDEAFQWWLDTIRVDAMTVNMPGGVPTLHFRVWCDYADYRLAAIDFVCLPSLTEGATVANASRTPRVFARLYTSRASSCRTRRQTAQATRGPMAQVTMKRQDPRTADGVALQEEPLEEMAGGEPVGATAAAEAEEPTFDSANVLCAQLSSGAKYDVQYVFWITVLM
ncbi:hypothetical protein FISHEDRAFT_74790 [Fistulina hepatica ATCC 64428]|uniref:Uncharacterized protein n=1 Tax=Fistulina hepatica ATCC 64428 TaxID=1128425 RepID=A0A0D7AA29_9AGAR|nr:hypothetical protein FISHEDRAFT_74790 [Fistulina hepatica ATCC 64428]